MFSSNTSKVFEVAVFAALALSNAGFNVQVLA